MVEGEKINGLTLIRKTKREKRKSYALFLCECGNYKELRIDHVTTGNTKYCGCALGKGKGLGNTKHGLCNTRPYRIWGKMKQRCYNPNYPEFDYYGGRGVRICEEWKDPKAFCDWAMSNGYADNLSIDRIDVNGNYEPSNCRWATSKEQGNNKRNNINITIGTETKTLSQWCEILNIPYSRALRRIRDFHWSFEDALFKEKQ